MARALVTGVGGFVGANLAIRLHATGFEVTGLARPGGTSWRLVDLPPSVRVVEVDLRDAAATRTVFARARADIVFHTAAYGAYSWQADIDGMIASNFVGTVNVVRAARAAGVETVVNTGSSSEYGKTDRPAAEDQLPDPDSDYAVTKVASTYYCRQVALSTDVRIPTLRLYSAYGPWEDPRRLITQLLTHGLRGTLPALTNPNTARDFVHIDDVCAAYLAAASSQGSDPGAIYNIGTGTQTTLSEIVALVCRTLELDVQPAWGTMADRAWDTDTWVADVDKAAQVIGWKAEVDLETGLEATADWLRSARGG